MRHSEGPWYRKAKDAWYAKVGGRQHGLGVKGKTSRKEAWAAWHKLMADGPKPKAMMASKPDKLTVRQLVDAFLMDGEARLKPNTVRIYRYDLDTLCRSVGTLEACQLTQQHLSRWLAGLPVNSTTKAMTLRSVSACLGWGVKNDIIPNNPVKKVAKPKGRSRSQEAVIGEADHAKLMEAATPDFRLVLRVLHGTGCRPGEACRITTDTYKPEAGCVVLTEHKADCTGKPRVIFLPPELVELLNAQVARHGTGPLLRSRKGKPWTGRSITQAVRRLKKKIGVKAIAYGYRHTFATDALANGVPDATVAALLGHSSTAMLYKHYAHLTSRADVLREAAARVR